MITGGGTMTPVWVFHRRPDRAFSVRARIPWGRDSSSRNLSGPAFVADLDGDGDLDLITGTRSGEVFLSTNEGTSKAPKFGKPMPVLRDGKPIVFRAGCVHPVLADFDRDGKPDLIVAGG